MTTDRNAGRFSHTLRTAAGIYPERVHEPERRALQCPLKVLARFQWNRAEGVMRDRLAFGIDGVGRGFQAAHADGDHQHGRERDQHARFDELDVRCRGHARTGHDDDYHRPDQDDPPVMSNAQQRLDQHPRAHHLRHQVADADDKRADASCQVNRL